MALALVIFEILVAIIAVVYFARRWYDSYLLRDIPSPPKVPIFGHLLRLRDEKKILSEMMKMQAEFGGVIKLNALVFYLILISDYKFTEYLLNNTKILDKSHEYSYFHRWLGSGLLTSSPEKWKKTRRIITPTFHFQILDEFIDVFNSASDILVRKLKGRADGEPHDIYPYITLCALDVICESAMGTLVHAQEKSDSVYVQSVQEISRIIRRRMFSPVKMLHWVYFFSGDYRREKKALKVIHDYTNSVIEKRKEDRTCAKSATVTNGTTRKKKLAFLDLLLEVTLDGRPMTTEEIRDEVNTFMFEGHDTTASAITFALFCLSKNPDIQDKVLDELRYVFGSDKDLAATSEDINNLKYLEMVIKETLRLYPSVPLYARKLQEDTEYYGGTLPKGISLSIFAYGLHRDPRVFPDPEKFDPERFTKESQQERGPFSYLPFSAGPRNCIGQKFAMMEMKVVLAKVLRHYEVLPVEGFEPILVPDAILKSVNGVEVRLRERAF